jgi:hypothetical protein
MIEYLGARFVSFSPVNFDRYLALAFTFSTPRITSTFVRHAVFYTNICSSLKKDDNPDQTCTLQFVKCHHKSSDRF